MVSQSELKRSFRPVDARGKRTPCPIVASLRAAPTIVCRYAQTASKRSQSCLRIFATSDQIIALRNSMSRGFRSHDTTICCQQMSTGSTDSLLPYHLLRNERHLRRRLHSPRSAGIRTDRRAAPVLRTGVSQPKEVLRRWRLQRANQKDRSAFIIPCSSFDIYSTPTGYTSRPSSAANRLVSTRTSRASSSIESTIRLPSPRP